MARVVLLTGGNTGDVKRTLQAAQQLINARVGAVLRCSHRYESKPWGFDAEQHFSNQALEVSTDLQPLEVLEAVQAIEQELGRNRAAEAVEKARTGVAYTSRPIDIDILFYDDEVIASERLTVPHPLLSEREFALAPLCEIMRQRRQFGKPDRKIEIGRGIQLCFDLRLFVRDRLFGRIGVKIRMLCGQRLHQAVQILLPPLRRVVCRARRGQAAQYDHRAQATCQPTFHVHASPLLCIILIAQLYILLSVFVNPFSHSLREALIAQLQVICQQPPQPRLSARQVPRHRRLADTQFVRDLLSRKPFHLVEPQHLILSAGQLLLQGAEKRLPKRRAERAVVPGQRGDIVLVCRAVGLAFKQPACPHSACLLFDNNAPARTLSCGSR